jgi:hypothetical protein
VDERRHGTWSARRSFISSAARAKRHADVYPLSRTLGVTSPAVKIPAPYQSYPPDWRTFDRFAVVPGPCYMGFTGTAAAPNRFAARFWAAESFTGVAFDELTKSTSDGYGALVRLALTYSAFEHLLRCIGTELRQSNVLLVADERDKVLAKLCSLLGCDEFFGAIRQHLAPRYQRHVDTFRAGLPCSRLYLAAAIRHAFAHGQLAASQQGVPPEATGTVCRYMCRVLFWPMNREFSNRDQEVRSQVAGVAPVTPNPSINARPGDKPPGPPGGPAYRLPGAPGALPPATRYLER